MLIETFATLAIAAFIGVAVLGHVLVFHAIFGTADTTGGTSEKVGADLRATHV